VVVIVPFLILKLSCTTLATGARQLVVQEAFEMTLCLAGSYLSSLTPSTTVMSSFLAGAVMITFFTVPLRCFFACSASVNSPVDSSTISAPKDGQSTSTGSLTLNTRNGRPLTVTQSCP